MVEDVVLTEAVVPDALAAVTELQIRVVGIRAAADGALVAIALLLGLLGLLLLGLTELDGLAGVLVFGALLQVVDLRPDEHGEVQQGHDGSTTPAQLWAPMALMMSKANSAPSRYASHFIFTGRMKNSSTVVSGNRKAKAKNMDRFT